jgi:hypothetical protein
MVNVLKNLFLTEIEVFESGITIILSFFENRYVIEKNNNRIFNA